MDSSSESEDEVYQSDHLEDLYESGGSEEEIDDNSGGEEAGIQPYRFEPEAREGEDQGGDTEDDMENEEDRLDNTQW